MDKFNLVGSVTLQAKDGDKKQRKFRMEAYNGGPMNFYWNDFPVVVDLEGMTISDKSRPILRDHDITQIVGHSTDIEKGDTLVVEGLASGAGAAAQEVVQAADNGFPWQASIGTSVDSLEDVKAGTTVTVNGQEFTGPITIVRASRLGEVSFVPLGADDSTSAKMVAKKDEKTKVKDSNMDPEFKKWLEGKGFDPETVEASEDQTKTLKAQFDAENAPPAPPAKDTDPDLEAEAAKLERIAAVKKLSASYDLPEIAAQAIREGWTPEKTELKMLRAARPQAPNINTGQDAPAEDKVLEAAFHRSVGLDASEHCDERSVEAANKRWRQPISLQEILLEGARKNGYHGNSFRQDPKGVLEAAFSTINVPGILSTTANKSLLAGYNAVEGGWGVISSVKPVIDFKTVTRYRMTGDFKYEKLAPGGEIKHEDVAEQSFTNKADTYARMFQVDRQDIINDDLSAFSDIPRRLGRGAALAFNDVFWTEFLADHGTFFTSGNGNLNTGAGSALSSSALAEAIKDFRRQTDADGNPLGLAPRVLLVPPDLEATALELVRSISVNTGGSSTTEKVPNINIYNGRFNVVVSSYLTNATAWYLMADPMDLAFIETVFLNGNRTPTVESADADFNTLGIQMRGYHDFGVNKQDYRAAVKNNGA